MRPTDCADALRQAGKVGPYFEVQQFSDDPGWIPLTALVSDGDLLRLRVLVVRKALAAVSGSAVDAIDQRAAASTHSLALASRLVAPAFGAAVLTATVPNPELTQVYWRPVAGGPVPIAFDDCDAVGADTFDELATLVHDTVVTTLVAPLVYSFAHTFRLSEQVLWGNVASAVAGAATMIGHSFPDRANDAILLADRLTRTPLLTGAGEFRESGASRGRRFFVRNNCCLFYRVPGGGTCGDCVLRSK